MDSPNGIGDHEPCPKRARLVHPLLPSMDMNVTESFPFMGLDQSNLVYATNVFYDYRCADGHTYVPNISPECNRQVDTSSANNPGSGAAISESNCSPRSSSDSGLSADYSSLQYFGYVDNQSMNTPRVDYNYSPISNEECPSTQAESQANYHEGNGVEDKRRERYIKTVDFLKVNGLFDVTMKTADLLKRNHALQTQLDVLNDEVAQYLTSHVDRKDGS